MQRADQGSSPLVSIVIRTQNRPAWAMEAVRSALSQTYRRTEILLVEDGPALCEPLLDRLGFSDRLTYVPLGKSRGRSNAGNEGLARAKGTFINFLDDDDLLYPDHIQTMLDAVTETRFATGDLTVAYGAWEIAPTECLSLNPLRLRESARREPQFVPYDKISLWLANYLPIQSVFFDRRLYDRLGGLDPSLAAFEDWEIWCRYSTMADFTFVPKVTSVFRVPHDSASRKLRSADYEKGWHDAREKINALPFKMDGFDSEIFSRFAEHYAARKNYVRVGSKLAKLLKRLALTRN